MNLLISVNTQNWKYWKVECPEVNHTYISHLTYDHRNYKTVGKSIFNDWYFRKITNLLLLTSTHNNFINGTQL